MASRKKAKKSPAKRGRAKTPDYPLLTLAQYDALTPQEKIKFLDLLRARGQGSQLDRLFEQAPELIEKWMETYSKHFGHRTQLTRVAMWAHLGVLAGGTATALWLGLAGVLESATVVAFLGPLYTYVLVNLRHLTGWRVPGESTEG